MEDYSVRENTNHKNNNTSNISQDNSTTTINEYKNMSHSQQQAFNKFNN